MSKEVNLISEAIARKQFGRVLPEAADPEDQAEADKICSEIFINCKDLLEQQGQKITARTPEEISELFNSGKLSVDPDERANQIETFMDEKFVPGGYHIGICLPDREGASVTLTSYPKDLNAPNSSLQITIEVEEIASTRGFLTVNSEGGILYRRPTGRWSDTVVTVLRERANLQDALQFKQVVDTVREHQDITPLRFA